MSQQLIDFLESQKMKVFGAFDSTETARKDAIDSLPECSTGQVTAAIMTYHNTLLSEIQTAIRKGDI